MEQYTTVDPVTIRVFHTNDVHSHFETWPTLVAWLEQRKMEMTERGEASLTFDIGDFIDRFHPISEATIGKANIKLLNEAKYDAVTIGNNEGITLSFEQLNELYNDADFQVLVGNLFYKNGERPPFCGPYQLYEHRGVKIGVIGLTVSYPQYYDVLGWLIEDPFEQLAHLLPIVRQQSDVVILLSHLGVKDDQRIAERFDGIDVILGAHTHHLFPEGEYVGNTLLCGTGKHGNYIGELSIMVDPITKRILQLNEKVIDLYAIKELKNPIVSHHLDQLMNDSLMILNEPVAYLQHPIEVNWYQPSPLPQLLAAALRKWTNSEVSFLNTGLLLEGLPSGVITKGHIHKICPHPINPCVVYLTGAELLTVMNRAEEEDMTHMKVKGFGFRGKVMGMMIYDGLAYLKLDHHDSILPENVWINGSPLDLNRRYRIGTIDMFTFGHLYPTIHQVTEKEFYLPKFLRDLLQWALTTGI